MCIYIYVDVRMYVYIYVCVYLCVYVCMCVYMYTYIYTYIHICVHIIYVWKYVFMYCVYTCVHVLVYRLMCVYIFTCASSHQHKSCNACMYIPGPPKRSPFSACAYKLPQRSTLPLKSECAYIFKRRPPLRVFACLHLFECRSEIVKRLDFGRCQGVQVYIISIYICTYIHTYLHMFPLGVTYSNT